MVSSCLQMEVSVTGTVGTLAQRQCAAALVSSNDASTEVGDRVGGAGGGGKRSVFLTSPFFILSVLPVLKAIKEQISSQREGR